ncbi:MULTISPECIES: carbohydrate ABC transporter permease [unclassified Rhizobium]|uniref:carbohydrate ABC transporter permease n=1 Tax=unclassified Rhizobium TaxID=2613769 RepID=UPI001ADBBE71|nr:MULTISPECIES: carbohydrate ABC transporter permease [unclassified Rhizobium]MBO9127292.1 carbohydrate ABC transporter permease [Rhizobium sp. 16-488-2b]MBO9177735.1 carbohydrate ABC transporter permease [Rhizobium sp. 16-488-2a]
MISLILRGTGQRLAALLLLVWSLGPVYWALATSLMKPRDIATSPVNLVPPSITFEHYQKLLGGLVGLPDDTDVWYDFLRALVNSLVLAGGATILTTAIAALAAYSAVRMRFPGRNLVFYMIVATLAVPGYTVLIPLYRMMVSLGLVDTYSGIILIYISAYLPLAMWLMRSVYESLPLSIEEAAYLDGAGRLYTMIRIVIPLATPGLIAAAILTFLGAWGQFSVPLVFAPTVATKPLTVLIPEFATKNYVDYGLINAAGILAMIPPALVVMFLNRYLLNGLMAGAGK